MKYIVELVIETEPEYTGQTPDKLTWEDWEELLRLRSISHWDSDGGIELDGVWVKVVDPDKEDI